VGEFEGEGVSRDLLIANKHTLTRTTTTTVTRVNKYGDAKTLWQVVETTGPMLISYVMFHEGFERRPDVLFVSGGGCFAHDDTLSRIGTPADSKAKH
jgi:hypothetical protein